MKSAVDVDDASVQQMVEESVEHAFEDLAARRWVEAKLKATELIAATRKGLTDAADEIDTEYRAQVEAALNEVEKSLAAEHVDEETWRISPYIKLSIVDDLYLIARYSYSQIYDRADDTTISRKLALLQLAYEWPVW